jgi:anti-sigma-K factor RskA
VSDDIHALSGAYAVDALDSDERFRFERHLAGCSACQAEVESLVAAASELSVLSEVAPPASLRAKVLAEIATVRPLPPLAAPRAEPGQGAASSARAAQPAPEADVAEAPGQANDSRGPASDPSSSGARVERLDERRRSRGLARSWRVLVAAATVAVLAVGGFTVWRQQVDKDPSQAVADQVLAAADATRYGTRLPGGATATVVRSRSLQRAVIVTSGMAQPPSGKVLQLWLQDSTGHMNSAGLMPGGGHQVVVLSGDASHSQGAGITVEPAGGSDQPTSNPIAFIAFA